VARKVKSANRGKRARQTPVSSASLRKHLVELLKGGEAHVGISDVLTDFPVDKRAIAVQGLEHTAWQLLEHIRIAQWDILEFSRNPKHVSPDFPDGYWPKAASPDDAAWKKSVQAVQNDLGAMIRLVSDARVDLYTTFPWGDGQTLLREALLLADHNAYHVGQIVDLRRALGIWKK
jgi:DinB superfamily